MLRTSLISAAILALLAGGAPGAAAGLVTSRVVERGESGRVKALPDGPAAVVEVHFGMGPRSRAATRGFVAASGRVPGRVTVSRGPRGSGVCLPEPAEAERVMRTPLERLGLALPR